MTSKMERRKDTIRRLVHQATMESTMGRRKDENTYNFLIDTYNYLRIKLHTLNFVFHSRQKLIYRYHKKTLELENLIQYPNMIYKVVCFYYLRFFHENISSFVKFVMMKSILSLLLFLF